MNVAEEFRCREAQEGVSASTADCNANRSTIETNTYKPKPQGTIATSAAFCNSEALVTFDIASLGPI